MRKDLRTVGVRRAALFVEGDPLQRAVVFHDLRDTGLTHMAVRGDSPILIQWAGGHTDFRPPKPTSRAAKLSGIAFARPFPRCRPGFSMRRRLP